jgi:hypothetical protein
MFEVFCDLADFLFDCDMLEYLLFFHPSLVSKVLEEP